MQSNEADEMRQIVICRHCGKPEYYGEMRWLNGECSCRKCYRYRYEAEYRKPYIWDDLNGRVPPMKEYEEQEG